MLSNHLIPCHPLLLLPSIFPSIRVFPNESALHIRWPKYWSFSFSICPSNEYSELISFGIDWFDLAVQGTLKSLRQHHRQFENINSPVLCFTMVILSVSSRLILDLLFLSFILDALSVEISLSYLYCKTHEDRDHPFSVFLSTLALSLILVPYRKHSSFFIWGFARVVVMVFLSLFFFLTLIQIIRQGWGWTGRKRRVNFALFCARRGKHLTTDFSFTNTKSKKNLRHTIVTTICGLGFPSGSAVESCLHFRRRRRSKFNPWVQNIPWKRNWQPTPVFLSGKSQGQRSLVGYSPWGQRESKKTEHTCNHTFVVYARHCVRGFIYLHVN